MAYEWQRWMPEEFRAAGLTVIVVDGWENRGRPASTGNYDPRHGVTIHHTGATTSPSKPGPTLQTLIVGRPDLPGPLAPWSVRHDGVVVVIAAGRCNHAGSVGKSVPFAALGADGNALFMGDEVDTDGTQDMPEAQRHAIAVTNAVYLRHFNLDVARVHRHQDISGTGKWDLGSQTTQQLRSAAAAALSDMEDDMASPEVQAQLDRIEQKLTRLAEVEKARHQRIRDAFAELEKGSADKALVRRVRDQLLASLAEPAES